jgi:hypothetical protein
VGSVPSPPKFGLTLLLSARLSHRAQLWTLLGLFAVSMVIILAGIALRISQGRFWLVHRVDSTVLIPNISLTYSVCAVAYAAREQNFFLPPLLL